MATVIPTLETERLILRPFELSDAKRVQELAGDFELARTTANVPHPYEDGMAEGWISTHADGWEERTGVTWAVVTKSDDTLIGCMHITLAMQHESGEMGYWIGRPYWGTGFGTEAAQAVVDYAFGVLKLHRVYAVHMGKNPGSGRVMQKVGMTYEGTMREAEVRWGERDDIAIYGILRHEWAAQ